jgi:hypothetical protein
MLKLLVGALLALTAANSIAGNTYVYKDKGGQVLLTNVNPSGNFDKFTKKVKVTYHRNDKAIKPNQNQTDSEMQNVSYGISSNSNSASYANSAYDSLR